jgi:hypothetical protein
VHKTLISSLIALPFAAAGAFGLADSAAAAALGTLNISGTATFANGTQANPATDTILFFNATVQSATSDGIFDPYDGALATIANISLTNPVGNVYQGTTVNPFIAIAPDLTFIADNPFSVVRDLTTVGSFSLLTAVTDQGITGKFVNASGESVGAGVLTANSFNNNGSFSMTLTAEEPESVPEPTFTLAVMAVGAVAASGALKKKQTV